MRRCGSVVGAPVVCRALHVRVAGAVLGADGGRGTGSVGVEVISCRVLIDQVVIVVVGVVMDRWCLADY